MKRLIIAIGILIALGAGIYLIADKNKTDASQPQNCQLRPRFMTSAQKRNIQQDTLQVRHCFRLTKSHLASTLTSQKIRR